MQADSQDPSGAHRAVEQPERGGDDRPASMARLLSILLLVLASLFGFYAALAWPDPHQDFYAATSQIIATLFIAIAVELFAEGHLGWRAAIDRWAVLTLIGLSWAGLFACIRAMLGGSGAWTSGLATAGLMAATILVSVALFERVKASGATISTAVILLLVIPPVVLVVRF